MEGNNDMPSASASETQPLGETGEEEEMPDPTAIFGNDECNGIMRTLPPQVLSKYINKVLCLSSLSLTSIVEQYG